MTVIRPNSISGVTSITAHGGDITYFKSDGTRGNQFTHNVSSTGVITATKFVGPIEGNLSGGTINATSGTITGNLGVGGVLTYEDVTNIDSIGIITARAGINVSGGTITGDGSGLTGVGLGTDGSANTSGIITATAFVPTTGQLSHRNIIINGDFTVAQRGTQSTSSGFQTVDRFAVYYTGTDAAPTQIIFNVDPPGQYHLPLTGPHPYKEGFRKAFGISNANQTSGAGAGDYIYISHKIEAHEMARCGWNYTDANSFITLSFWVKQGVNANLNFYGYLKVPDSSTTQHYAFETGTLAFATWKKVVVKIPGDSDLAFDLNNSMGMEIVLSPFFGTDYTSSGASLNTWGDLDNAARMPDYATTWYTTNNASFQITGVQLEVGPVATPFEHLSFAENKRRCGRYCQRSRFSSFAQVGTPGTYYFSRAKVPLTVPMRAAVTGTIKQATWLSNRYFAYKTWSSQTNVTTLTSASFASSHKEGSSATLDDISKTDVDSVTVSMTVASGSSNAPLPANGPGSNNVFPIEVYDCLLEAEM